MLDDSAVWRIIAAVCVWGMWTERILSPLRETERRARIPIAIHHRLLLPYRTGALSVMNRHQSDTTAICVVYVMSGRPHPRSYGSVQACTIQKQLESERTNTFACNNTFYIRFRIALTFDVDRNVVSAFALNALKFFAF